MSYVTPVIIFSAFQNNLSSSANSMLHSDLMTFLRDNKVDFTTVAGKYKGQLEQSVMIKWSEANEQLVQTLTKMHNQDCYLSIGRGRHGSLHAPSGKLIQSLGMYETQLHMPEGDYSYVPSTGQFFTFRPL